MRRWFKSSRVHSSNDDASKTLVEAIRSKAPLLGDDTQAVLGARDGMVVKASQSIAQAISRYPILPKLEGLKEINLRRSIMKCKSQDEVGKLARV